MKKTEGIILKKFPRKEADVVFEIYTQELGLAHFQAKGVRKQEAKLKFGLDIFNRAIIYYVPSRFLPIVVEVQVENNFNGFKNDLARLKLAAVSGYIIRNIFEPGLADENVWKKISAYFNELDNLALTHQAAQNLTYLMCYRLLGLNGLQPELVSCVKCRKPVISPNLNITLASGGLAHRQCLGQEAGYTVSLSGQALSFLNNPEAQEPATILSHDLSWVDWLDFKKLTQIFFQYYFGLDLAKLI